MKEDLVVPGEASQLFQVLTGSAIAAVESLLERAVDVTLLHHLAEVHQVVPDELGQVVLAHTPLHWLPQPAVHGFVLARRQAHEEVVADEVCLGERATFAVQAFEDPVRVVLLIEDDADQGQLVGEARCVGAGQLVAKVHPRRLYAARRGVLAPVDDRRQGIAVAILDGLALRRLQLVAVGAVLMAVENQVDDAIRDLAVPACDRSFTDEPQQQHDGRQPLLAVDEEAFLHAFGHRAGRSGDDRAEEVRPRIVVANKLDEVIPQNPPLALLPRVRALKMGHEELLVSLEDLLDLGFRGFHAAPCPRPRAVHLHPATRPRLHAVATRARRARPSGPRRWVAYPRLARSGELPGWVSWASGSRGGSGGARR
jgi:hypothetical protein